MTTATAEKLTPAQTALLDRITLDGPVYGVAVPKGADEASLNTARSLVRRGLLTESQDDRRAAPKFDLAESKLAEPKPVRKHQIQMLPETPPQEAPLSRGLRKLATALRRLFGGAAKTTRALTRPALAPHYTDPNKRAQKVNAKARRRAKNRVAAKSRRVNRLRSR